MPQPHSPRFSRAAFIVFGLAALGAACTAAGPDEPTGASADEIRVTSSFTSKGTGYYPDSSALEGGFNDRRGVRLRTLQQFLAGSADYVSVAMDTNAFRYGTRLRIKELEAKYHRAIVFRVVDTGGAFRGRGRTRIDICTANRTGSLDPTINGTLHIDVIDETRGPDPDPAEQPVDNPSGGGAAGNGDAGADPVPDDMGEPPPAGSGRACGSDGACNPGNDGSGEICTAGKCVTGCRTRAQCPGAMVCTAGQCQ